MQQTIIAFHGPKRSGKSTAARMLAASHGAKVLSFADPLRRLVGVSFDIPEGDLIGSESKEVIDPRYGVTPRWLMQHVGDGVRDAFGSLALIRALIDRVLADDWPFYVVDDCRFLNEVASIRTLEDDRSPAFLNLAGYVIHLERTDRPPTIDPHRSEREAEEIKREEVDGWIQWNAAGSLGSQVASEISRLSGKFAPVRRAINLAAMRRAGENR